MKNLEISNKAKLQLSKAMIWAYENVEVNEIAKETAKVIKEVTIKAIKKVPEIAKKVYRKVVEFINSSTFDRIGQGAITGLIFLFSPVLGFTILAIIIFDITMKTNEQIIITKNEK